jgi:hypothetical protein
MEVETEPNEPNEQYKEYVKLIEMKQSDDISGEENVDDISRLIYYGVKIICLSK